MLWEKKYPADIDWSAEITGKPLYSILDDTVASYGNRPCIDFLGKELSYKKISLMVDRAALGFQKLGVTKGTKVGLFLPNCPHFVKDILFDNPKRTPEANKSPAPVVSTTFVLIGFILIILSSVKIIEPFSPSVIAPNLTIFLSNWSEVLKSFSNKLVSSLSFAKTKST